ncbi:HNH endonuclease [Haloarcula virus HVTV-2]|uniref:HNH nuclease domain-containing protein n=1 Tax=Haloarcula vallismortis tailed virus 1 TaxID=1262528 RepID=L7TJ57_9CAUD|nr:endonuclease [Haloarcula vallismortis tailed virus 1]AGC34423.1 hypothetical protein HVTV1_53 [Haloarcula vallismortis tailed virus 1]UBF22860.1 HNH endonuclease [Haloarcula virus HVTV-2]
MDFLYRFRSKVDMGEEDECWEWKGAEDEYGYGRIRTERSSAEGAHRVAYRLEVEDPDGSNVLHKCDNRSCVNPNHLYLGTQEDNIKDRDERGRTATGEEHGNARLHKTEVQEIKWKIENTDETLSEIAEGYGVTTGAVGHISSGRNWTDVEPEKPGEA